MSLRLDVPVLCGSLVRLEPLALGHGADLALAVEEDRSSYRFTMVPRAGDVTEYLAAQLGRAYSVRAGPGAGRAPGEEGTLRDSAMFSVIAAEWPAVKSLLVARAARLAAWGD